MANQWLIPPPKTQTRRQKSLHLQGTKEVNRPYLKGKVPEKGVKRVSSPQKGFFFYYFRLKEIPAFFIFF
jgi:hypothetical protein